LLRTSRNETEGYKQYTGQNFAIHGISLPAFNVIEKALCSPGNIQEKPFYFFS
jgi:hypothetical protein